MCEIQSPQEYDDAANAAVCGNVLSADNFFNLLFNDLQSIKDGSFFDDCALCSRVLAPTTHNLPAASEDIPAGNTGNFAIDTVTLPTVGYPTCLDVNRLLTLILDPGLPAGAQVVITLRQGASCASPIVSQTTVIKTAPLGVRDSQTITFAETICWPAGATRQITVCGQKNATGGPVGVFMNSGAAREFCQ